MVLAQRVGRAGDVEVAERDAAHAVGPGVPEEGALERALRLAVRVDRPERGVLRDRRGVGDAVDGRGGREDHAIDADLAGRLEQRDAAGDVVAEVAGGVFDRLADQRARRAMEDRLDVLGGEEARHRGAVAVAPDVQLRPLRDRGTMPGREVVEDHDVVARREERLR